MAQISELKEIAKQIRYQVVDMIGEANSGHPGGSLSAVDILVALYFEKLKVDPKNPKWEGRDRFVLSKGHACPALYATLAKKGFFPEEELMTLRKFGSRLQGHPDIKHCPGVEASTGSLGQGISIATGMAIAAKMDRPDVKVYTLLGDGESQEGLVWEAAEAAAHYKLDNFTVIVDYNGLQIDGKVSDVMDVRDLREKFEAFGFTAMDIEDGNDIEQILKALDAPTKPGSPKALIAHTTKGKGVSFMENQAGWHGKAPGAEDRQKALKELEN